MNRHHHSKLLVSVCLVASTVHMRPAAADASAYPAADRQAKRTGAAAGTRRTAPPVGRAAAAEAGEEISVRAGIVSANGVTNTTPGGGLMARQTVARSQSTMTRDFIAKQSPAANVAALLNVLPGVVAGSNSPIGNPSTDSLQVRGLTQAEMGFEMEGVPLQDPVNFNIFTGDMVDQENISSISLTQGSSDIGAPFYSAVGGQVSVSRVQPTSAPGGLIDVTYGSLAEKREFIRLDSGEIGHSGIRTYVSYSDTRSDPLRGYGFFRRDHLDSYAAKSWGDNNFVHALFTYNDQTGTALRYPTKAAFSEYGDEYGYDSTYTANDTNYYKLHYTSRRDILIGLPTHLTLANNGRQSVTLDATPYYTWDNGVYGGGEEISPTDAYFGTNKLPTLSLPNVVDGEQNTVSVDNEHENTEGLTSALSWNTAHNTLRGGYWYSYVNHAELESFSPLDAEGEAANLYGGYPILVDGRVLSGYNIHFVQQTNALFVEDHVHALDDRLDLGAGFREVMISRDVTNLIPGATYEAGGNYAAPLPKVSASYKITPNDQIFINGTTGYHAPASEEVYIQLFDPDGGGKASEAADTNLKAEYAIGEEIGYRHYGLLNLTASLFNYNLTNHQVTSASYVGTELISEPLNVGGETIRGAQIELGLRPWHHLSPYASFQYLHTAQGNNYYDDGDLLPTKGKEMVQSPELSGSAGISYDDGSVFGLIDANYVGKQYATFMNDQSIPGYVLGNLSVGYRFHSIGFAKHPQIQFNLNNIAGAKYLSGVYGFTGAALTTRGIYGTSIAGSAPSYVVGASRIFLVTLTTGF